MLNSNHRLCYKVLETEVMLIAGTFTLVTGFLIRLWAVESPYLTSIINQNEIVSPLTSWKRGEFSFKSSLLSNLLLFYFKSNLLLLLDQTKSVNKTNELPQFQFSGYLFKSDCSKCDRAWWLNWLDWLNWQQSREGGRVQHIMSCYFTKPQYLKMYGKKIHQIIIHKAQGEVLPVGQN